MEITSNQICQAWLWACAEWRELRESRTSGVGRARGRDSWCWPKVARPLGTRMSSALIVKNCACWMFVEICRIMPRAIASSILFWIAGDVYLLSLFRSHSMVSGFSWARSFRSWWKLEFSLDIVSVFQSPLNGKACRAKYRMLDRIVSKIFLFSVADLGEGFWVKKKKWLKGKWPTGQVNQVNQVIKVSKFLGGGGGARAPPAPPPATGLGT